MRGWGDGRREKEGVERRGEEVIKHTHLFTSIFTVSM